MAWIDGTDAADSLQGSDGPDTISGLGGDDTLYGGLGNDLLQGGEGNDRLLPSNPNDPFTPLDDGGFDTLAGGPGNDFYGAPFPPGGGFQPTILELPGEGRDTLESYGVYTGRALVLPENVEVLILKGGPTITEGNAGANEIAWIGWAGAPPLRLYGLDGDDQLTGGDAQDFLDGGAGADTLIGGGGSDTYRVGADDIVIETAAGDFDVVLYTFDPSSGSASGYGDVFRNIETSLLTVGGGLAGGSGDDLLSVAGFSNAAVRLFGAGGSDFLGGAGGNDLLIGDDPRALDSGNDSLSGRGGADTLLGGAGDDLLDGGTGDDALDGGAGADSLIGGAGNDFYVVDDAGDVVLENLGEGSDVVYSAVDVSFAAATAYANVEYVVLTGTASRAAGSLAGDALFGTEGANALSGLDGNDYLDGRGGDDAVDGGAGDDGIVGGDGADYLAGGAGTDTLVGGEGADALVGGSGIDALFGGAGSDLFVFGADAIVGDSYDVVGDFASGDLVQLSDSSKGHTVVNADSINTYLGVEISPGVYYVIAFAGISDPALIQASTFYA